MTDESLYDEGYRDGVRGSAHRVRVFAIGCNLTPAQRALLESVARIIEMKQDFFTQPTNARTRP